MNWLAYSFSGRLMRFRSHKIYKNSLKLHEWTLEQRRRARSEGKEPPDGEFLNFQTPELSSLAKLVRTTV